jgi:hypothetical protein
VAGLLSTVGKDLRTVGRDDSAGKLAAQLRAGTKLDVAASFLSAVAKLALSDLPPSCAPGLRAGYATAMRDFRKAAAEFKNARYLAGAADVHAGNTALTQAQNAIP